MKETKTKESKMIDHNEELKTYTKELRKKMKKHFPSVKISIYKKDLDSVYISWNLSDGPTYEEIKALIPENRKIKSDEVGGVIWKCGTYFHFFDGY